MRKRNNGDRGERSSAMPGQEYNQADRGERSSAMPGRYKLNSGSLLGTGGLIFMCLYLVSLIGIGVWGKLKQKENTMAEFFLAGRGMGLFVLFITLYATQYSGNTIVGYAGKAYRDGFTVLMSVTFMMSVIGGYLVFAPKLFRLSRKMNFITIGDYIQYRFSSRLLTVIAVVILILALGNFILTNMKAMGHIVEVATGGRITFLQGVIALSFIMVVYETLGGLRSVAWTDVIQGLILLLGVALILGAIEYQYGGLSSSAQYFMSEQPELWQAPTFEIKMEWLSTILIVFFGIPLYPQAVQRIYAAKDEKTLRRSFQLMVFMPLVTTLFIVIVGIVGRRELQGLDTAGSEQITFRLLGDIAKNVPMYNAVVVVFVTAAVAAIMSTIDSALLAIASLFTQDIYRPLKPRANENHLTNTGKIFSWAIMAVMAYFAIAISETIWKLMYVKLEILCQLAPMVYIGIHKKSLKAGSVLAGLIVGCALTIGIMLGSFENFGISSQPLGVLAGIWGLTANILTIGFVSIVLRGRKPETEKSSGV